MSDMFCYQCQEAAHNTGCDKGGVCGKTAPVARSQDFLIWAVKGLSEVATRLREAGREVSREVNRLVTGSLFTTITNANFDEDAIRGLTRDVIAMTNKLRAVLPASVKLSEAARWDSLDILDWQAKEPFIGVLSTENEDVRSLRELVVYGLKGLAAYSKHANVLMKEDEEVDAFIQSALAKTMDDSLSVADLVQLVLDTGSAGVKGMALLDEANTSAYGHPEITQVDIGVRNRPGILISGHDLKDLEMLLEQTRGQGVDVYTHSEMLPAQYYPFFKGYEHFAGNYGNAWWKQKEEFDSFNGPILMTTNCIVPPRASYAGRLFTTGMAGYPGCRHIPGGIGEKKDFSEIIALANT